MELINIIFFHEYIEHSNAHKHHDMVSALMYLDGYGRARFRSMGYLGSSGGGCLNVVYSVGCFDCRHGNLPSKWVAEVLV